MRSEKELFKLAQMYVGLEEQFNRATSEFELDEIKYELMDNGYDKFWMASLMIELKPFVVKLVLYL